MQATTDEYNTYRVTVICKALNYSKDFTVKAEREGLAKTHAIHHALLTGEIQLTGQLVEYKVTELSEEA